MNIEKIKKKFPSFKENIVKRIFSEKGVFEIDKSGKLWNMEFMDDMEPYIYDFNQHTRLYIDRSIIRRKDESFQIVPEHICDITNQIVFSLSPNAMVKMVIVCDSGSGSSVSSKNYSNVRDIYFETEVEMNIQQHCVREDIASFLTVINFQ